MDAQPITTEQLSPTAAPAKTHDITRLKQDLSKVARTMYTQSLSLNEKVRTLSILQALDTIILGSNKDIDNLSSDITQVVIDSAKFSLATIFAPQTLESPLLTLQGWSTHESISQYVDPKTLQALLRNFEISNTIEWMRSTSRYAIVNMETPDSLRILHPEDSVTFPLAMHLKNTLGIHSLYITKLIVSGHVAGVIMIGLQETSPHLDDIELIERIGNSTGIALYSRLLYEENLRTTEQLRQTNQKLKDIDATKDEFIAMASHQLRTPLTSMKGYLSMVLEGDYGKVDPEQKYALQQSYSSAQRMVYLISDLLSVSRLKTGKFVIMNKPTDLTKVIAEEVAQLQDTAKSKNITLLYYPQPNIPKIKLDTTKMRQVIMNFLDNAVYYTPNGGKVTTELKTEGHKVIFTVTDTGMGVPESEKAQMFSKFYRASNAKKTRPDGTGLGLYMASKVIAAQGGEIIFNSQEGVGSVFGFSMTISL